MRTRCGPWLIVHVFMLVAVLVLGATPALATVSCPSGGGKLEIDDNPGGNVIVDNPPPGPPGPCEDWQTLFGGGNSGLPFTCSDGTKIGGTATSVACVSDLAGSVTIFTGGGSKDEHDIPDWAGKNTGGLPDKDNLVTAFAARYSVGTTKVLYFGGDRFSVSGDAQIGFWFFQNPVVFDPATGAFSGTHKNGDVLILSNFTNGGTQTNISAFKVNNYVAATGAFTLDPIAGASGVPGQPHACDSLDHICAATSCPVVTTVHGKLTCSGTTPSLNPAFSDKSGTGTGLYGPVAFFEGGLDLGAAGLAGECFSSFLLETRSSQTLNAVLKDFILGNFESCTGTVATDIHDQSHTVVTEVVVGTKIHDYATVTGEIDTTAPSGTVTFSFFDNATCTPPAVTALSCEANVPLTLKQAPTATLPGISEADMLSNDATCFRTPGIGAHSYKAHYNGDDLYPAADGPCEPMTVVQVASHITTRIVVAGTSNEITNQLVDLDGNASVSVQDEATVTCDGGVTPTGTVTFTRYDDGACTGTPTTDNCGNNTPPVGCPIVNGKALSSAFSLGANALSFKATYNGNDSCKASVSASLCEPVCAIKPLRHCSVTTDKSCTVDADCSALEPSGQTCVLQNP